MADDTPVLSERASLLGLGVVLVAFALFAKTYFAPAILEPDDNGYYAQGSLIARTGKSWFTAESSVQYLGLHWLLTPDGRYLSRYPPGMPLVIAPVFALFGHEASVAVSPFMALVALAGTFFFTRRLTNGAWALTSTTLLAVNPSFTTHALTGDSHVFLMAVLVCGLALLLRWYDTGERRTLFFAGLVLGCIPTVRYPDAVVAVGVVAFLLASRHRFPDFAAHFRMAVFGAAVPIGALLIRNQLVLGGFWRTGYTLTNEQGGFSPRYFTEHFSVYLHNLTGEGLRSLFFLGLLGLTWMVFDKRWRAPGLLLLLATSPVLLLYMTYYWAGGTFGTMRFMLPMFPLYLAGAAWVLRELVSHAPRAVAYVAPLLLLVLQLGSSGTEPLRTAEQQHHRKAVLATLTAALEQHVPPGRIVVTQGELLQHLDFVRTWKLADEAIALGVPIGLFGRFEPRRERADAPQEAVADAPGAVQQLKVKRQTELFGATPAERRALFLAELERWRAGQPVYLAMPERMGSFGVAADAPAERLKVLARVELPNPSTPRLDNPPPRTQGAPLATPAGFVAPATEPPPATREVWLITEWTP